MNEKQQKAVEYVKQEAFRRHCYGHPENHEYKRFDVETMPHNHVMVIVEVGRKNDEGTMAQMFARDKYQIFIGPRGGLSAINNRGTRIRGRKVWSA